MRLFAGGKYITKREAKKQVSTKRRKERKEESRGTAIKLQSLGANLGMEGNVF